MWNQIDYILCSQRWRSSIQSAKTILGADYGSDCELFIAKFRLKLKKIGKITRPFQYDLNQIPYKYIMEVRNRFKGLDLIKCLKNYGWRFVTLYRRQGSRPPPRKRNAKRQNGCLRKAFLSLLAILWNSAFKWVYLSFSLLLFASLLFTTICKASSDNHFAFLQFFFLEMVLIPVSYTMSWTSIHSSSGSLSDLVP